MKKTLAAVAVLGAFAGSALAADVTLYGVVDLGLQYVHNDYDDSAKDNTDKFQMASGMESGSRFGLKGTEQIGDNLTVGFVLENGFDADTGSLGNNGRIFGRESNLFIRGSFGELSFGRVGQLSSGNGSYGLTGNLSPFGTSWANSVEGSTFMVGYSRMDNTITYKTPTFAGVTVYAQYSSDMNTKLKDMEENKGNSNRYYALGATYSNGGLNLVGVVDSYNWNSGVDAAGKDIVDIDDGITVTIGGSYDFEVVKAYFGAQYFDNMNGATGSVKGTDKDGYGFVGSTGYAQSEGYSVMAGVDAPVMGGKAMFAVGYAHAEDATDTEKDAEYTRWGVSAGYDYALSKRTDVYAVAAYYQDDDDTGVSATSSKPSTTTVFLGMRHKF